MFRASQSPAARRAPRIALGSVACDEMRGASPETPPSDVAWETPPRAPSAQPDPRIPWIGYLANEATTDSAPILRDGLREHEWIEGQSIKIWYRYAQGKPELYPQHADDLVRLNVAVIVAIGPGAVEAARRATKTIAIVAVSPEDLALGNADANLTGITTFA